jgi:hypothetical protein
LYFHLIIFLLSSNISSACKAQAFVPLPVSNFALTFPTPSTSIVSNQPHSLDACLSQWLLFETQSINLETSFSPVTSLPGSGSA